MPALACNTSSLLANAACLLCFSDKDLLAAKARFREEIRARTFGGTARTITQLLADSTAWRALSPHQRLAIDVAQIANDSITSGARASWSPAGIKEGTKCYCAAETDLRAIIAQIECLSRQG